MKASVFGIYPSCLADQRTRLHSQQGSLTDAVSILLRDAHGRLDGLVLGLIELHGARAFAEAVATGLACEPDEIHDSYQLLMSQLDICALRMRGADVLTLILRKYGVMHAFAYPGTSELALCDSIARAGHIHLINGRGDKEQRTGQRLRSIQVPAFQGCEPERSFFFERAWRLIVRRWIASTCQVGADAS